MSKIRKTILAFCLGVLLPPGLIAAPELDGAEQAKPLLPVLVYFYSEGCPECRYVKEKVLSPLQDTYASSVEFDLREMSDIKNLRYLLSLEKRAGKEIKKTPPLIFFGGEVFEGKSNIEKKLLPAIEKYTPPHEAALPDEKDASAAGDGGDIVKRFRGLGAAAVIAGGLIDGINPCAFATLIFFLSYLALTGKRGKALLAAGASYSFGVFAAYLLIGIGLFEIVRRIDAFPVVSRIVSAAIGCFSIAISILSLYDYFRIRKGGNKKAVLQLGSFLKKRIHAAVRTKTRAGLTVLSGIALGAVVGLLEFPCTGQVYFPIVVVIREIGAYRMQALGYLLLYNVMFILPLLAVFALAYSGTGSDWFADMMKHRLKAVKLLSALLFGFLGILIFIL